MQGTRIGDIHLPEGGSEAVLSCRCILTAGSTVSFCERPVSRESGAKPACPTMCFDDGVCVAAQGRGVSRLQSKVGLCKKKKRKKGDRLFF